MKNKVIKIFISIIIIGILVWIAEKLLINDKPIEVANQQLLENQEQIQEDIKDENEEYNVLVIGNSITIERDGIGMAASDQYHDYYYFTQQRLQQKYKNLKMNRISAIHWEENRIIRSRTDWIKDNLTKDIISDLDLVIFQLGDNCVPTETFENSMTEMVNHVKTYSPNAEMVWVGMWFVNEERLNIMFEVSKKLGMKFVNISDLVVEEYKSQIGQKVVGIDGKKDEIKTIEEAFHPNDAGMKAISDRIIETLGI